MEIKAPKETLLDPLQKVIGATTAPGATAPVHACVLLHPNDIGGLAMTAANSKFQVRADCAVDTPPNFLAALPARKFMNILRLLHPQEFVSVSVKEDRAVISAGNSKSALVTHNPDEFALINESYPDSRGLIPRGNKKIVVFEREKFLETLTRVSVLCDEDNTVIFNLSKGRVKMRCENRNGEESVDEISVNYEGDDLEVEFDFQLLKEMLGAIEFSAMRMSIHDASGGALFEPAREEEGESAKSEFQCIIAPMRAEQQRQQADDSDKPKTTLSRKSTGEVLRKIMQNGKSVRSEITAPKEALLELLQKVIGATASHATMPVHAYVLLHSNNVGGLSMTAANAKFQIRADCAVDTPPNLLTTLPARKFMDILRLLRPRESVSISVKEGRAMVSAGGDKFTLITQNPDEFTLIGEKPDEKEEGQIVSYRLDAAAQLLGSLKMVYYAAAQKRSHRMYFNGVLLEFEPGVKGIALAATDGNRLAINRAPAELLSDGLRDNDSNAKNPRKPLFDRRKAAQKTREEHTDDNAELNLDRRKSAREESAADDDKNDDSGKLEAILPREPVGEILHNMESNLELEIDLSQRYARFRMPGYELITSVIDESYPDYRGVIPLNNEKIVVFEREKFLETLNCVSVLCDKEINNAVIFNLSKGKVKMQCENRNGEEAAGETSVNYEGDDLEIGFNFQFLKEMLGAVEFPVMRMFVHDTSGSALFEPVQEEVEDAAKSDFQYIIMPIRL